MSSWMNETVPNHHGNGFSQTNDPNITSASMMDPSAFMANPGQQQFNPQQFNPQQQQQMAAMQGASMRNASPSFHNPVYQTNPVVPSKRSRPREDSIAASPGQNPSMLPASRSETPQQNFPGNFPHAMPSQGSGQFSHLQANGSANASPSPIMGNQMRPGSVPQRVSTASPHPFSPNPQQFNPSQTSPVPSEHGTPQPNHYMQEMPQQFNPNFAPSPSNPRPSPHASQMAAGQMTPQQMQQMQQQMGQMPNSMYLQMQQQQQQQQQPPPQQHQQQQAPSQQQMGQARQQGMIDQQKMAAYQMRLQQQMQGNMQMQAQMQAQNMGRGMMGKQPMQQGMPNGQMPAGNARPQGRGMPNMNPEHFMKSLAHLMQTRNQPFDPQPIVNDRPVNLMMLFQAVQSRGGHKAVTAAAGWAHIAQAIGVPMNHANVASALRAVYERNLSMFEEAWQASQKQRMQQQPGNQNMPQNAMRPGQQNQHQAAPPGAQPQGPPPQTPVKGNQALPNGFTTPQPQSHQGSVTPGPGADMPVPSPGSAKTATSSKKRPSAPPAETVQPVLAIAPKSDTYEPCLRELSTYGGVDLQAANRLGPELERWRPDVPPLMDLGNIDVAALTRSLESRIHGEVRLALDTLAAVSSSPVQHHFLQLRYCEDLVEVLVECAEEQLDLLTEATAEVSDEIQLNSYEELMRTCRTEQWAVKDTPEFGSRDYNLDRAVDRLICITTILRNLSFGSEHNENHFILAQDFVVDLLCDVIRYLGTRTMLLRTHVNTLDFMKDVVILLSNIAGAVEIPGREQALSLLQFLLAFAPVPGPSLTDQGLSFASYDPSLHIYLPHALDALAKLLARDEPNRTYYKQIFALDAGSTSSGLSNELLSRVFAFAMSPFPDKGQEWTRPPNFPSLVEMRKPFLMQGLLSSEILASIIPSNDPELARQWLSANNGLGHSLFRFIQELTHLYERPQAFGPGGPRSAKRDPELVYIVVVAVSLLRRLHEKARDTHDASSPFPTALLPPAEALIEALSMPSQDWTKEGYLQQLTALDNLSR